MLMFTSALDNHSLMFATSALLQAYEKTTGKTSSQNKEAFRANLVRVSLALLSPDSSSRSSGSSSSCCCGPLPAAAGRTRGMGQTWVGQCARVLNATAAESGGLMLGRRLTVLVQQQGRMHFDEAALAVWGVVQDSGLARRLSWTASQAAKMEFSMYVVPPAAAHLSVSVQSTSLCCSNSNMLQHCQQGVTRKATPSS